MPVFYPKVSRRDFPLNQILTIAWRELTRLRKHVGGGVSPLSILLLLVVAGLAAYSFRSTISLGSGLYQIGVTGDVAPIHDSRFLVIQVDGDQGRTMLKEHILDVWIDGTQVFSRDDNKSQYAIHAIKQYMEQQELARIGNTYPESQAFPLRVG